MKRIHSRLACGVAAIYVLMLAPAASSFAFDDGSPSSDQSERENWAYAGRGGLILLEKGSEYGASFLSFKDPDSGDQIVQPMRLNYRKEAKIQAENWEHKYKGMIYDCTETIGGPDLLFIPYEKSKVDPRNGYGVAESRDGVWRGRAQGFDRYEFKVPCKEMFESVGDGRPASTSTGGEDEF